MVRSRDGRRLLQAAVTTDDETETDSENYNRHFHDRLASFLDGVLPDWRGGARMARRRHFPAVCPAPYSESKMVQKPLSGEVSADPCIRDGADAARSSFYGRLYGKRYSAVPLCVSLGCSPLQRIPPDDSHAFGLLGICIHVFAPWTALERDHAWQGNSQRSPRKFGNGRSAVWRP